VLCCAVRLYQERLGRQIQCVLHTQETTDKSRAFWYFNLFLDLGVVVNGLLRRFRTDSFIGSSPQESRAHDGQSMRFAV
jgi:hypothetical protein